MDVFVVKFKNGKTILFMDILQLNNAQKKIIRECALNEELESLKLKKSGIKIPLEEKQRKTVISIKDSFVADKTEEVLYNGNNILFEGHSIDRIIKRIGNPSSAYLMLIRRIKHTNTLHKDAEWKGYPRLSYTFMHDKDSEQYKFTLAFIKKRNVIKVVTVSNFDIDNMDFRITEDEELFQRMLKFKEALTKRLEK